MCSFPDLFWRLQPGIDLSDKTEAEWKQAFDYMNRFDQQKGVDDLKASVAFARTMEGGNGKVGTMGYCLGGRLAMMMALQSDAEINVSYYGVALDNLLGGIDAVRAPLLLHIADQDKFFPPEGRAKVVEAAKAKAERPRLCLPGRRPRLRPARRRTLAGPRRNRRQWPQRRSARCSARLMDTEELAALVPDGALLALPPDNSLAPCAFARALIRRGVRNLRLLGVPVSGFATDLLIGAGCVAEVETSRGHAGRGRALRRAFRPPSPPGRCVVLDATCPCHSTPCCRPSEKGVPFMPLRGVLGSDLLEAPPRLARACRTRSAKRRTISCCCPALQPDVAAFHAVMADEAGNVWVGRRRELATIAHAARKRVLVTVERIGSRATCSTTSASRPARSARPMSTQIAVAERGAWPIALLDEYDGRRRRTSPHYGPRGAHRGGVPGLSRPSSCSSAGPAAE